MNSLEQVGGQSFSQNEFSDAMLPNLMQIELAHSLDLEMGQFVQDYAGLFREELNKHPEWVTHFREDPDGTLEDIKKTITYH